jgi:hypothetical protein
VIRIEFNFVRGLTGYRSDRDSPWGLLHSVEDWCQEVLGYLPQLSRSQENNTADGRSLSYYLSCSFHDETDAWLFYLNYRANFMQALHFETEYA